MSMYVDFHVLQTVPPSCVNRDDVGSPKTAVYGGAVRARVSSQAWKRAMRLEFKKLFSEEELGIRTKLVVDMVAKEILALDSGITEETAQKKAISALSDAGLKVKDNKAEALFFISTQQAKAVAEAALGDSKGKDRKKEIQTALSSNPSVDIALFGRMLAGEAGVGYDAAAQVAHAISTHAVQNEYDYFTAMDDLQADDATGAAHLDTVEFNSSTLYRYATVNLSELAKNLGAGSVPEVISKFGRAFICSMPTGKQNTFANRTVPDAVYVTVRSDQPVNLCGAFEKPVKRSADGYVEESEKALVKYAENLYENYANQPVAAFGIGDNIGGIAEILPLPKLLEALENKICEQLSGV